MNLLFSCIGQRGYIADFFRPHLSSDDRIIGTGNTKWTPGFAACDASFILPDIGSQDYVPSVLELCERERIDAILSFLDPDVHRLASAEKSFQERGITPLLPSKEAASIAFDKLETYEFLRGNEYATPETVVDISSAKSLDFPVYVKPRRGSGSRSTFVARNERELEVFFSHESEMVIQEAVVGDEINIELCGDLEGRPVGISTWRKLRSRLGETEQAETFRDPTIIEFGLNLGQRLAARGPMDIDVILDGGQLVVLEFNTRFGGGYPVSHLAGADFPKLLIQMLKHGRIDEPHFGFEPGIVMMKRLEIIGGRADEFFASHLVDGR